MFQYAHGFVISGGQFHNQYVVHTDSSCEQSVSQSGSRPLINTRLLTRISQDKILRRLNYLIAIVLF